MATPASTHQQHLVAAIPQPCMERGPRMDSFQFGKLVKRARLHMPQRENEYFDKVYRLGDYAGVAGLVAGGVGMFKFTQRYRIRQYRTALIASSMYACYRISLSAYEGWTRSGREHYRVRLEKVVQTLYSKEFEKYRRQERKPLRDQRWQKEHDLKRKLQIGVGADTGTASGQPLLLTTSKIIGQQREGRGGEEDYSVFDPRRARVVDSRGEGIGGLVPRIDVAPAPLWVRTGSFLQPLLTRNVAILSETERKNLHIPETPLERVECAVSKARLDDLALEEWPPVSEERRGGGFILALKTGEIEEEAVFSDLSTRADGVASCSLYTFGAESTFWGQSCVRLPVENSVNYYMLDKMLKFGKVPIVALDDDKEQVQRSASSSPTRGSCTSSSTSTPTSPSSGSSSSSSSSQVVQARDPIDRLITNPFLVEARVGMSSLAPVDFFETSGVKEQSEQSTAISSMSSMWTTKSHYDPSRFLGRHFRVSELNFYDRIRVRERYEDVPLESNLLEDLRTDACASALERVNGIVGSGVARPRLGGGSQSRDQVVVNNRPEHQEIHPPVQFVLEKPGKYVKGFGGMPFPEEERTRTRTASGTGGGGFDIMPAQQLQLHAAKTKEAGVGDLLWLQQHHLLSSDPVDPNDTLTVLGAAVQEERERNVVRVV
ncbi:unnamed protein product [Amoebophrya sp. A25]|nr:unnamed protein product [Amoebophrya sp. A25]|eukprot:GSA25T00022199001.1